MHELYDAVTHYVANASITQLAAIYAGAIGTLILAAAGRTLKP